MYMCIDRQIGKQMDDMDRQTGGRTDRQIEMS